MTKHFWSMFPICLPLTGWGYADSPGDPPACSVDASVSSCRPSFGDAPEEAQPAVAGSLEQGLYA